MSTFIGERGNDIERVVFFWIRGIKRPKAPPLRGVLILPYSRSRWCKLDFSVLHLIARLIFSSLFPFKYHLLWNDQQFKVFYQNLPPRTTIAPLNSSLPTLVRQSEIYRPQNYATPDQTTTDFPPKYVSGKECIVPLGQRRMRRTVVTGGRYRPPGDRVPERGGMMVVATGSVVPKRNFFLRQSRWN